MAIKFNDIPKIIRDNPKKANGAIQALAQDGERWVKQQMQESPASGNSYVKPSGSIHTASSPGNPPRIDDGILINSINTRKAGNLKYRVRAGTDYAFVLEFGSSKMAARPVFVPMIVYVSEVAPQFFAGLVE